MNWAKLDAGLIAALGPEGGVGRRRAEARALSVFVHVDPAGADAGVCRRLGLGPPGEEVLTATLSPAEVAELTEVPWVSWVALSGRVRLFDDEVT